jgi:hypothetical protein
MNDVKFFKIDYVHKLPTLSTLCPCKKIYYDLLPFSLLSYGVCSVLSAVSSSADILVRMAKMKIPGVVKLLLDQPVKLAFF